MRPPQKLILFFSENSHILPSDWPDVGRFTCFTHWNSSEAKTAGLSFNISGHNTEISLIWDQFNRRLGPLFLETICRWYPEMKRNAFLSHLNSVEPSIQFTLEREKNRHFPLLYLNVYREKQGNLGTSVYRKPTHIDKYLAFDSQHPICHKKSVAKTLIRKADCLSSSLDSKAEERKDVSNVLKANGYTKTFLRNCRKPVTTSSTPGKREPATGFAVIPYIQGVTEPIGRILNSHNVKVAQEPFRIWGILLSNLRILSRKNNEPTLFILFPVMTVITSTSDRPNVSLVNVWKSIKKWSSFTKIKFSFIRTHMPNQPYN